MLVQKKNVLYLNANISSHKKKKNCDVRATSLNFTLLNILCDDHSINFVVRRIVLTFLRRKDIAIHSTASE